MSNSDKIFLELSNEMGFEIKNGRIITIIGGSDRQRMHNDLQNIGTDMRTVLSRRHG